MKDNDMKSLVSWLEETSCDIKYGEVIIKIADGKVTYVEVKRKFKIA